jgi:hypothetical protein
MASKRLETRPGIMLCAPYDTHSLRFMHVEVLVSHRRIRSLLKNLQVCSPTNSAFHAEHEPLQGPRGGALNRP